MSKIVGHPVAFGDEIHKPVRRRRRRDVAQRAHADGARRDLKVRFKRKNDAAAEAGLGKLLRDAGDAKADPRQRDEKIVGAKLDLRLDVDAVLLEELLHIDAGARLPLQKDQREGRDLFDGMRVVKIAVVIRRGHEDLMGVEAVPDGIRLFSRGSLAKAISTCPACR